MGTGPRDRDTTTICYDYQRKGMCRFGNACRYLHAPRDGAAPLPPTSSSRPGGSYSDRRPYDRSPPRRDYNGQPIDRR